MQLKFSRNAIGSSLAVMRRAGYSAFTDPVSKEDSFVLRLNQSFYPRFHAYIQQKGDNIIFDVHLDQKQPSYGQGHMHAGEYDGPVVEREVKRIASWAHAVAKEEQTHSQRDDVEHKPKEAGAKDVKKWYSWFWT